jgi:hypothetical protein
MIFPVVVIISRALGPAFLVLHVVVAWALFLVAVRARWNT